MDDFNLGITRRDYVKGMGTAAALGYTANPSAAQDNDNRSVGKDVKQVAAVMTGYHKWWHPDVILGKIFDGWKQDGGPGPALQVVSMYIDQQKPDDLGQQVSVKHNVPIYNTIEKAVTVGGDRIPVDGVISIGETGNYPTNEKAQDLFPRRRFFAEITDTFQ